jgi:hypothetical protein
VVPFCPNNADSLKENMLAHPKARLQTSLLLLGAVFAHIVAFLALAHIVVFSTSATETSAFMGVKIALPSQPQVKPTPPVSPMPTLELADGSGAGRSSDLFPSIPPPQTSVIHSFDDTIAQAINSDIQNSRNDAIRFMPKSNIDRQIHGAGNGESTGNIAGNGVGTGAGEDKGAGETGGNLPTSQDDNIAIIVERHSGTQYLHALRHQYPKATIILSWSGRGDFSPDPKIWTPVQNQLCNPDGTVTPDPQHPWIDEQELDVKGPDIFTNDLYAGIYWAMDHGSKAAMVISNFDVITNAQNGYNSAATQALITAMRRAHLQLFVVAGGQVLPLKDLSDFAIECGGTSLIDGPFYGSPDWESYTKIIGRYH